MVAIDFIVIGIILVTGIIGLISGVVKMTYKLITYVFSIILAVRLANPAAEYLKTANFYQNMIDKITSAINSKVVTTGASIVDNINDTINQLPFPENIKTGLAGSAVENSATMASSGSDPTVFAVSTSIADFLTIAIAGILLFIILKIIFSVGGILVSKIADAPIIKQLDRSLGLVFGCAVGLLIVFSLFTGITLFSSNEDVNSLMSMIEDSTIAHHLYNNNPINDMLVNKM